MLFPQAGMEKPFSGSFSEVVKFTHDFFSKNPALAEKNGWSTDTVETFVDQYNAQRMIAGGYLGFIDLEGELPPPGVAGGASRNPGAGVAGKVSTALTGAAIWKEMFQGSKPVAKEEAERRAAICIGCPQNQKGGFKKFFVASVAKGLTELVALMNREDLSTSKDSELGTCMACDCPLPPKVFVSKEVILRHTKPDVLAKLDAMCWITK